MTDPNADPYLRIVCLFDQDPVAGSFLTEDGEGGFAGAVFRMAREIERLSSQILPEGSIPMPKSAAEAEAMEKLGFAWLKSHQPDLLTPSGTARPVPAVVHGDLAHTLSPSDYQLLARLERDNKAGGSRHVVEGDADLWKQGFRLSDAGLIAIEQHAKGGIFHITRLGMKALSAFRGAPAPSTNPQHSSYTERYDGID
jgi:hypothetical protein